MEKKYKYGPWSDLKQTKATYSSYTKVRQLAAEGSRFDEQQRIWAIVEMGNPDKPLSFFYRSAAYEQPAPL